MENLANRLQAIDWLQVLGHLQKLATSEPAKTRLQQTGPLTSVEAARKSFAAIAEAQVVLSFGERPFMESLDLFPGWYARLKREGVLTTLELRDVRRFCIETVAAREVLIPHKTPWASGVYQQLMEATEPLSAIDQIMTASGEIRADASETLYNLYREKTAQTKQLQTTLDRLTKQHEMEPVLQERYVTTREGRWVIPVKSGMQGFFPGIIHASSATKQTVFMEPEEVIPLNNRLRQIEVEIEEEVERLLVELSKYLHRLVPEIQLTSEALLETDLRLAQAKFADILQAVPVQFNENRLQLLQVRHPLLVLKNEPVIPNSVQLSREGKRILLLSGPNAGGKTVLLKSVGLAVQMIRCGLFACVEENSHAPFFRELFTAVGDAQSVDAQLSTFAAHLKILDKAGSVSGTEHLLLIDEICGSTDPEEGSALARSFIESYAKNGVFAVVTSHLGPLKVGWGPDSAVTNGSLEYDSQSGRPTYQFFMGVPGQSLALQTAKRVGVNAEIIERALNFLSPESKAQHQHLQEIESLREELQGMRKQLVDEVTAAREHKKRYMDMLLLFKRDRDQWLEKALKKAEKKLDEKIEAETAKDIFARHEKLQQIKQELPEIVKASQVANRKAVLDTAEDFEKIYPPGSPIFISSIGQEGVVQGKSNSKGEVPVLSRSMRLFVHWQQLRAPQNMQNPTTAILRRTSGVAVTVQDFERVIDLRGKSTDDALSSLENQLDAAALNGEDRVKIVHGHGTEALKRAVRSHLSRSIYVKKWMAAAPDSGGDGITWAELKE